MYAKVFASLWDGSLRGHPFRQLVFIYLLAHADDGGVVEVIHSKIADDTGLESDVVVDAIAALELPDEDSRSLEDGGRALVPLDEKRSWGWRIVNYKKYRDLRTSTDRKEYQKEYYRKRIQHDSQHVSTISTSLNIPQQFQPKQKKKQIQKQDKDMVSVPLTGGGNGVSHEALKDKASLPPGELTSDEVFSAVFWPEYPRKVARRAAEAAWKRLRLRDTDEETMVAIMAGLRRDIRGDWKGREQDKIPHASTWINQRRWEG